MPYIKCTSGINWFYQLCGHGEPLVFIHGWAGDSFFWTFQQNFFRDKFTVVSLDLPGHGKSQWREMGIREIAADIKFILDTLQLKGSTLVASSFGGLVALRLVREYASLVKRLALVGSFARFTRSADYPFGINEEEVKKLDVVLDEQFPYALEAFSRLLFTEQERLAQSFNSVWSLIINRKSAPKREALKHMLFLLKTEDLRAELEGIRTPTLLVRGKKDYLSSAGANRYLNGHLQNSHLVSLDGCGHIPFMTVPEIFNRTIQEFIEYG